MKTIHKKEYRKLLALLVESRKEKDITQAELARVLKKPQSYVSKFENGERRLDVIEMAEVCKALDVELSKLLKEAGR